jgi:hypothetical protein
MILQPGDKVRFLNEKGEGIIKSFINSKTVSVEMEGFEIPVPTNQIVKIESHDKPKVLDTEVREPVKKEKKPLIGSKGIFIALEPEEGVFSSSFNIWFINNTHLKALFSFSVRKNNGYYGLGSGICESQSVLKIKQISREELKDCWSLLLQVIFHENGFTKTFMPVEKRIDMKEERLKQLNLLKKTPINDVNAFLFTVADFNEIIAVTGEMIEQSFLAKSFRDKLQSDAFSPKEIKQNRQNLRINPKNGTIEVDLHIEELLDNYSGLSNAEIVKIQLAQCRKAIDMALFKKSGKLIIIHGVGNGTLKTEVRNLIRSYENLQYFDAPAEKYGYGATEVDFRS